MLDQVPLYFFSSCFMASIQAFWLVAVCRRGQDRDVAAVVELLGEQVYLAVPIRAVEAWLTNTFRRPGASES